MRLEMKYFDVKSARFGEQTSFAGGVLTIDKDELIGRISGDPRISSIDIVCAHPGERIRIANVLEIIEPRVKGDKDHYFPGMLGPLYQAGEGQTHALRGAAVFEIGSLPGLSGSLVDMAGEGARFTPHSKTVNVCLLTEPSPEVESAEYAYALKQAGLAASVYLAQATKGAKPDEIEVFDLGVSGKDSGKLPRVACLIQLHSHGVSREPFVYGSNIRHYYPTVLHPNEILDGAIVCGHYNLAIGLKNSTYTLLNHPLIRGLYRRHNVDVDFRGVVVAPEPTSLSDIKRTSMMASGLLKNVLAAEGVIITKEGGGHTDVDLMENCNACERIGIETVLIDNEWLSPDGDGEFPLLASSPNADAMISVGNMDGVVGLEPMDRIIGGTKLSGGIDADLRNYVMCPIWSIPNAISQAGFTYLSTEAR